MTSPGEAPRQQSPRSRRHESSRRRGGSCRRSRCARTHAASARHCVWGCAPCPVWRIGSDHPAAFRPSASRRRQGCCRDFSRQRGSSRPDRHARNGGSAPQCAHRRAATGAADPGREPHGRSRPACRARRRFRPDRAASSDADARSAAPSAQTPGSGTGAGAKTCPASPRHPSPHPAEPSGSRSAMRRGRTPPRRTSACAAGASKA